MFQSLSPQARDVIDKIVEMTGYENEASDLDANPDVERREVQTAQNKANDVLNALKDEGVFLAFDGDKVIVTRDGHTWLFYDGQGWVEYKK